MATNETTAIREVGTTAPEPAPRHVRLGALSFAWHSGALRWLRVGDVEVVRGIASVLRDPQWGTHAPVVDAERIEVTSRHASLAQDFHLPALDNEMTDDEPLLRGALRIEASEQRVTVDLALDVAVDFSTARSGLSVLLPLVGVAGAKVEVVHTDGRREAARLPRLISPSQPLFAFRQLRLSPAPGVTATLDFEGDVFEMEDQRNWSDASFKIYNRPLAWPTPYVLKAGERVSQRVTVTLDDQKPAARERDETDLTAVSSASLTMPAIGCGVWLDRLEDISTLSRQLDAVAPRHLDVLLDLRVPRALEILPEVMVAAAEHGAAVWLHVVCEDRDPAGSLSSLARRLERLPDGLTSVPAGMLVTPAAYLQSYQPDGVWPSTASPAQALAVARDIWPTLALGGGVPTYFTELNRCRPDSAAIDFITHAVSPVVHAVDDRSVMETLESVAHIVDSCRALAGDLPYRITTVAVGAWTNPYGDGLTPNDGTQRMTLSDRDPRQRAQFAAAWSVGFVARAARAGVDAITLSSLGPPFDIGEAPPYPVGHVIAGLARAAGRPLCHSAFQNDAFETGASQTGTTNAALATLAWETETPAIREAWVANLTAEPVALGLRRVEIIELDLLAAAHDGFQPVPECRASLQRGDTISLPPLAVLRVCWRR